MGGVIAPAPAPGQEWRCEDADHKSTRRVLALRPNGTVLVEVVRSNKSTARGRRLRVPLAAFARYRYLRG